MVSTFIVVPEIDFYLSKKLLSQANPADPRTFPFILLGNKIDVDGGNSRVVRIYSCSASMFLCSLHVGLSIVFPGF